MRPLLEYNTFIWSPSDVGCIRKLESVQRRFTKRIYSMSDMSYEDRLTALGLETLEYRRLKFDLVMIFKIVHNLVDLDRDSLITVTSTTTRNSFLKIFKPRCESSLRMKFLCVRCVNVWNSLSESTKASSSIVAFKNNLNKNNLIQFLNVFKF